MRIKIYLSRYNISIILFVVYWMLLSINVLVVKQLMLSSIAEWWINTIFFLSMVLLCVLNYKKHLNIFYRLLFIPAAWIAHAILTIPASSVLGIIMHDPNHLRTAGEHRAVFILASIPILLLFANKSKILNKPN